MCDKNKMSMGKLFANHIYPEQCQNCQIEATRKCVLVVEECKCKNFVPLNGKTVNVGD